MSVGEFDPASLVEEISDELIDQLCSLVADGELKLEPEEILRYATFVKHEDWKRKVSEIGSKALMELIRLFTLGEEQYSEWIAEEKSPVIIFVRELKTRDQFEDSIKQWIKNTTTNKFLPHGSLMDLL